MASELQKLSFGRVVIPAAGISILLPDRSIFLFDDMLDFPVYCHLATFGLRFRLGGRRIRCSRVSLRTILPNPILEVCLYVTRCHVFLH